MKRAVGKLAVGLASGLGCLLAVTASAQAQQPPPAFRADNLRAVVVGIARYARLGGGQQLQFADRDATAWAEFLKAQGVPPQNIRLLTGPDATTAAMKSAIGDWLASAPESDTAVIFYSGHGLLERQFGEAYLLGYDSDPKAPYATALAVSDIQYALTRRFKAANVLILADGMRRDFFDPETEPTAASDFVRAFAQLSTSRAGASVLLANSPGEYSREGHRWQGSGAFTRHLIDTLSAQNTRGAANMTAEELYEKLSASLAKDTLGKQRVWRSDTSLAGILLPAVPGAPSVASRAGGETAKAGAADDRRATSPDPPRVDERPARTPARSSSTITPTGGERPASPGSTSASTSSDASAAKPAETSPRVTRPSSDSAPAGRPPSPGVAQPIPAETNPPATASRRNASPKPPTTTGVTARESSPAALPELSQPRGEETVGTAPRPAIVPPSAGPTVAESAGSTGPALTRAPGAEGSPSSPSGAPSPLLLQLEIALSAGNIVEPAGSSALDLYQRLVSDGVSATEAGRFKPRLAEALLVVGRSLAISDIRVDNVSDKIEDLKRAGQILSRARTLGATTDESAVLEKLSAAQALIALQFYDEAERAVNQLLAAKHPAVENAMGLVYHGKLDNFRAERAFKRAIDLDSEFAPAHYNLAMIYRSAQNAEAVSEFERAAALAPSNAIMAAAVGDEYFARESWEKAAAAFRKAVALKPNDDTLHTKLGHALFSQGLTEEANRAYQRASELRRKQ